MTDRLYTIVLELDRRLESPGSFSLGGGLGLFLKQEHLRRARDVRTLYPIDELPAARTTNDADIFLRADVVADVGRMRRIRDILDDLEFEPIESAKFMQFAKTVPEGVIKVDLLVGPLGDYATKVRLDTRRVKPPSSVGLHARRVDEALGIDARPMSIPLAGRLLSGEPHTTRVLVPSTFAYALMKLMAFRDRVDDADKNLGRYHAVDLYRIVGMATEAEIEVARALSRDYARDPALGEARAVVERYFRPESGLGRTRIREYGPEARRLDLDRFVADLLYVLGVG